jgi:hypothetical protein
VITLRDPLLASTAVVKRNVDTVVRIHTKTYDPGNPPLETTTHTISIAYHPFTDMLGPCIHIVQAWHRK